MEYTRLGSTGLQVSRICLGMMSYGSPRWREWVLDLDAARPLVRAAAEAGITFYDTADMYSVGVSEEITGALLRELFASRDDYVLATKVFNPMGDGPNDRGLSRKHIMAGIDASLRRLGTDHVDLYQIHRWDPDTPVEETMEALHDVVRAGKARYLGASSMFAWQFATAQYTADLNGWTRFVSMQDHYNLLYREEEREMHPLCLEMGIGVIPWSPLARGVLAGTRTRDQRTTTRSRSATSRTTSTAPRPMPTPTTPWSMRCARSPTSTAGRRPRSRWPGCCTSRCSPRRSWAPPSRDTSRTRWPRSRSS